MPSTEGEAQIDDLLSVARAGIAAHIAKTLGVAVPPGTPAGGTSLAQDTSFLTVLEAGTVGFPIAEVLSPLIWLERNANAIAHGEDFDSGREGVTLFDERIDDELAFLQDHLLNVIVPFAPRCPAPPSLPVANTIYERILREAHFAERPKSVSTKVKHAEELLYVLDDDGLRQMSPIWQRYAEFEAAIEQIEDELHDAVNGADPDPDHAQQLEERLASTMREWKTLGSKRDVEDALSIVERADNAASFETRRNEYLARLEGRRAFRKKGEDSYALTQLSQIDALLFPEKHEHQWRSAHLDSGAIASLLDSELGIVLGAPHDAKPPSSLTFKFIAVRLDRDWLTRSFFGERFWEFDSVVSDGAGSGTFATDVHTVYFVRDVVVTNHGEWELEPVRRVRSREHTQAQLMAKRPIFANEHAARLPQSKVDLNKAKDLKVLSPFLMRQANLSQKMKLATAVKRATRAKRTKPLQVNFNGRTREIAQLSQKQHRELGSRILRVKPRPAKPRKPEKNPGAKRKLTLKVTIRSAENPTLLDGLDLQVRYIYQGDKRGPPLTMPLSRLSNTTIEMEQTRTAFMARVLVRDNMVPGIDPKRWRDVGALGIEVQINRDERVLIHSIHAFPDDDGTARAGLDYSFERRTSKLVLAEAEGAALFAYGFDLTPAAPNADPQLDWGGTF